MPQRWSPGSTSQVSNPPGRELSSVPVGSLAAGWGSWCWWGCWLWGGGRCWCWWGCWLWGGGRCWCWWGCWMWPRGGPQHRDRCRCPPRGRWPRGGRTRGSLCAQVGAARRGRRLHPAWRSGVGPHASVGLRGWCRWSRPVFVGVVDRPGRSWCRVALAAGWGSLLVLVGLLVGRRGGGRCSGPSPGW